MPIEIRELVIRAVVEETGERVAPAAEQQQVDRDEIIEECIEQIMQILRDKSER